MKRLLSLSQRFLHGLASQARPILFTASLIGLGVGFWMILPALGIIVPCGLVFGLLVYSQLRGVDDSFAEDAKR